MKTKQRKACRAILAITLAMIMCMMTAAPAAAGQRAAATNAADPNMMQNHSIAVLPDTAAA